MKKLIMYNIEKTVMGVFKPNLGRRLIRFKIDDDGWFKLHELKSKMGCSNWDCFVRKLIEHAEEIANLINPPKRIPP